MSNPQRDNALIPPSSAPEASIIGNRDMVSIRLTRGSGQNEYCLQNIEIYKPNFHHKLTHRDPEPISQQFQAPLVSVLNDAIAQAREQKNYLNQPNFILELPQAILGRLRIICHANSKGTDIVIVKVAYFVGDPHALLGGHKPGPAYPLDRRDNIDAQALLDICAPAIAAIRTACSSPDSQSNIRSAGLGLHGDTVSDLTFYLSLLQRFISSSIEYCALKDRYSVEERSVQISR